MLFKQSLVRTTYIVAVIVMSMLVTNAQERKREYINAIAQGTSVQLGKIVSVSLIINELSTPDDQKVLIAAFAEKGSEGVANALGKMHSKGRISLTGTLGFDVNYIREFPMPGGGKKIRFVTDRPITFGELWHGSRSQDYALSLGEIIIAPKQGDSTGTIVPAAQFQLDKENELSVEAFQNPWKLVSVKLSK
jgi:hypothetical protein